MHNDVHKLVINLGNAYDVFIFKPIVKAFKTWFRNVKTCGNWFGIGFLLEGIVFLEVVSRIIKLLYF